MINHNSIIKNNNMEEDETYEKIFDQYNFSGRVEKTLKNYSDWLLGISIGLGAVFISLSLRTENITLCFIFPLISVFFGILYSGNIKRNIFLREIKMNTLIGKMKQIVALRKISKEPISEEILKEEHNKHYTVFLDYSDEDQKLSKIAKNLEYSSILTFVNVIITGVVILFVIIKNSSISY